jgi:hypothetical protein
VGHAVALVTLLVQPLSVTRGCVCGQAGGGRERKVCCVLSGQWLVVLPPRGDDAGDPLAAVVCLCMHRWRPACLHSPCYWNTMPGHCTAVVEHRHAHNAAFPSPGRQRVVVWWLQSSLPMRQLLGLLRSTQSSLYGVRLVGCVCGVELCVLSFLGGSAQRVCCKRAQRPDAVLLQPRVPCLKVCRHLLTSSHVALSTTPLQQQHPSAAPRNVLSHFGARVAINEATVRSQHFPCAPGVHTLSVVCLCVAERHLAAGNSEMTPNASNCHAV